MTTAQISPDILENGTVVGTDGDTIGKVGQVFLDNQTGEPTWVTVKTGWFGTSESFVPLDAASVDGDSIRVPYDKDMIKGAPNHETDAPLSPQDEDELYSYYGIGNGRSTQNQAAGTEIPVQATNVDTAANQPGYLTRSEEQLHVGTEQVETGRARLRKFVVTEQQTLTVPVTHEEVRVVREPLSPGDSVDDVTIGEAQTDVVLTEERVVVNKETVPVEKVRLGTETVTEQQQVTEAVRKEQIEFDNGTANGDVAVDQPNAETR